MRTSQIRIIDLAIVLLVVQSAIVKVYTDNQTGRHTYVVRYKHGEILIPVTVVLDYKRQTEYVINMNSRTPAKSMTLYDFKERVIAYKDLKNGECFIGRLTYETIQDEDAVLKRLQSPVESQPLILTLERDRPSMTPTEVRNMAGHKTAVFCRRMNTWTIMPAKQNRRNRRDTLHHLDRPSTHHDQHITSKHASPHRGQQDNSRNNQDIPNFHKGNESLPALHRKTEHQESSSAPQTTILDSFNEHQNLNNIYPPFILPRQKSYSENDEDGRNPRQSFGILDTTKKTVDDNIQQFSSVHERSNPQILSEFPQSRFPGLVNGTALTSSARIPFIPLDKSRPVLIPSINFPNKYPENKLTLNQNDNQINSPGTFPIGYPQSTTNFHTLYNRGETIDNFPSFHQLPPEAFVLPLTRSSTATTPSFVFNNRLGYEIVHPESSGSYNYTDPVNIPNGPSNQSSDIIKSSKSELTALDGRPPFINPLERHEITAPMSSFLHNHSTLVENDTRQKTEENSYLESRGDRLPLESPNRTSGETSTSSSNQFDNFIDHSDTPIQIPRWYPEITKQISIPLQIEVLHHQEEYFHGIGNVSDQVHSLRGHEVEDHSSPPLENTLIHIPVEAHYNGERFNNKVKLLPQVSPTPGDSLENTSKPTLPRQDEKANRTFEPVEFRRNYPFHREESRVTQQETSHHIRPAIPISNSTQQENINIHSVSTVERKTVNQILQPSSKSAAEENIGTPKIKSPLNEGGAIRDFKIDEGVPSYRKRFPTVSQLFPPEETVADIGKLPDRHFRQQGQHTRRRPPPRNRTRGIPPRSLQPNSAWRKHRTGTRNLVNRQQPQLGDQGITFHHRGYAKPGSPYDQHRKRMDMLPPGVSVHPRHPQAPYADLATDTSGEPVPVNPLLHTRPRRIHLRHQRRHQRKRNRILSTTDSGFPSPNCCAVDAAGDGSSCCPNRRRGRHFPKNGCCTQSRDNRRPNLAAPPESEKPEVPSRRKVEDVEEDRCMKEKMCRTVYQSTKKVLVCRNIAVEGC